MQIPKIELRNGLGRTVAIMLCLAAAAGSVMTSIWAFGHAVAINAEDTKVAELGVQFAPADPAARFQLASLLEKTLLPEDQERAVNEFEKAVAFSPNNYAFWLSLGIARERAGDPGGAEAALRKAVQLAPNYSRGRWALGNNLLRQDRMPEAFAELRLAAFNDVRYAGPITALAWEVFDKDLGQLKEMIGNTPAVSAAIADLLVSSGRHDEARMVWREIPRSQKRDDLLEIGKVLCNKLLGAGRFAFAQEVAFDIALIPPRSLTPGAVTNGGFEDVLVEQGADAFTWKFSGGDNQRVGLNETHKRSGRFSLLMSFTPGGKGFRPLSQNVAVESGAGYQLSLNYRSEIVAEGKIKCEVVSAGDGRMIAETELPTVSDWAESSIQFDVPTDVEGITMRINIVGCAPDTCQIAGNIWFDDFRLERR